MNRNSVSVLVFLLIGLAVVAIVAVESGVGQRFCIDSQKSGSDNIRSIEPRAWHLPNSIGGDIVLFGDAGEAAILGGSSIYVRSRIDGEWVSVRGGNGDVSFTRDGGLSINKTIVGARIKTSDICTVEGGIFVSSGNRILFVAGCDHSLGIWSVPTNGDENWYLFYFTPTDDEGSIYPPDSRFEVVGNRIFLRSLTPRGSIILATDDFGKNWTTFWGGGLLAYGATDFSFVSEREGWILREDNKILKTTNGGSDWKIVGTVPLSKRSLAVSFLEDGRGVIVGEKGLVLVTRNGGQTWTDRSLESEFDWNDVSLNTYGLWMWGNSSEILGSRNFGDTWVRGKIPNKYNLAANLSPWRDSLYFLDNTRMLKFDLD